MHDEVSILVSVPEFATRTSLSARHIWRLIREHKIPSHLVGRRRVIPLDSAVEALIADHTSCVAPKGGRVQTAWIPVIDQKWHEIHGTERVQGGALKSMTDGEGLRFYCPICKVFRLRTNIVGVSSDFNGWGYDGSSPPVAVFKIYCQECNLFDHFKMPVDQHGMFWTGDPLPQVHSHQVSLTTAPTQAVIPIISEEDLDKIAEKWCHIHQVETDTDYIGIYCPLCDAFLRGGGSRMVAAVCDPESELTSGELISISAFLFELCCGPKCGFVGNFLIPVTGQTLQLCAQ